MEVETTRAIPETLTSFQLKGDAPISYFVALKIYMTQALSPVCAYCKLPKTMTREHLWPKSLHRRQVEANQQVGNAFWMSRLQKDISGEPTIRDVCAECNNIVLSALDKYICDLYDRSFVDILEKNQRIRFEYDYHFLKRWLLKLSFNSARIHNSPDLVALDAVLPYILGRNDALGKSVQLFVELSYPEELPEEEISPDAPTARPFIFRPTMNRVGHLFFRVPDIGQKLLRAVHLRSFSFYLAYFEPGKRGQADDFSEVFIGLRPGTYLLRPSRPTIELECIGVGAWESFKSSRSTQFAFKNQEKSTGESN